MCSSLLYMLSPNPIRNIPAIKIVLVSTLLWTLLGHHTAKGDTLFVGIKRWLEMRDIQGRVIYRNTQSSGLAQTGIRLRSVGDLVQTAVDSSVVLAIDTGIGFVDISEQTTVQIQQLDILSSGGYRTRLRVTGGQARLRVRPFNNPDSTLEIETPSGWSGVRGTEFGVAVHPDGKTGIATLEGSIISEGEDGSTVTVEEGLQSLVIPGEPPDTPTELTDNPNLNISFLGAIDNGRVRVVGETEPINLVYIEKNPQITNREGQFDTIFPLNRTNTLDISIVTPLGQRQDYELVVPRD